MHKSKTKGYLITIFGVLAISPDGLLTRFISADSLTITFWRGLLFGLTALLLVVLRYRGRIFTLLGQFGMIDFGVMTCYCFSNLMFIYSITHTSVANTLFMLSTTPIWAALISRLFLGETVPRRTLYAIAMVILGIVIITRGSAGEDGAWLGDIAGLFAAAILASQFTLVRASHRDDAMPALALGGIFAALLVSPFVEPALTSNQDLAWLLVMGVVMLPIATTLLFLGPRYLPAPEVGLMVLLETILGPIWVWLVIHENPGIYSIIGGVVVLVTLTVHTLLGIRDERMLAASTNPSIGASKL